MRHVTFSCSGGGSLKHGLKQLYPEDFVVSLHDSLNIGPINEPWNNERKDFMNSIWHSFPDPDMKLEIDNEWEKEISQFWAEVLSNEPKTVWWSSKSAMDWCGLMMLLEHLNANLDIEIIDVSEPLANRHVISVGELAPDELVFLKSNATLLTQERREQLLEMWKVLKVQQEKPVRWLTRDGLISVHWDVIDQSLLENLKKLGKVKAARLIGECLCIFPREFNQVTDAVLWYRLQHLISQRKIAVDPQGEHLSFNSQIQIS